jgi:acyl carrier protein
VIPHSHHQLIFRTAFLVLETHMQISDAVLQEVRRLVADILQLELDEVLPDSLFFDDLGGESIELIELSFHVDKLFGVRPRFQDLAAGDFQLNEHGCLTAASLANLKSKYPFLQLDGLETQPLRRPGDVLTITAIAGFVQLALNARTDRPLGQRG